MAAPAVGCQRCANLVVGDDRKIDQESENAGAEEIPEARRYQEHHRPVVRERCARLGVLLCAELQKFPDSTVKWYHLRGGEEGAQRHVFDGSSREVDMVPAADDAPRGVKQDIEIDDGQRDAFRNYSKQDEDARHHDGGK
jgi:hypothetical protein